MIRYPRSLKAFAVCLSVLAGYVDGIGFLSLGGFFVSFMSGNSTRLSVGLAGASHDAPMAGGLIAAFVLGVVLGSFAGRLSGRLRPAAILALVGGLLAAAAALAPLGLGRAVLLPVAMAMGAENTVFEREGEVSVGVTYMTGALVKLGQRLAAALCGGDRLAWLPFAFLWGGLVAGAVVGALAYGWLGLQALWLAAAAALVLGLVSAWAGLMPD